MPMPARVTVPIGFGAFDGVARTVDSILEADTIKDIELELRSPAAFIGNAS